MGPLSRQARSVASIDQKSTPDRSRPQHVRRAEATGLVVVLSATFLGQFDFFVVNVAGPSIRDALRAGAGILELIVGGYAFAYAAGLMTAGRLGDLLGFRRMFLIGVVGFGIASLLCGVSQTAPQLVAARLLQGGTASVMLPQVLAYITASVEASRRARAIAWYAVAAGLGGICGQVLGGVLVQGAGWGWRWIFLVNLPVVLAAAVLGAVVLPRPGRGSRPEFDVGGAAGVALTVAAVLVPLTLGPGHGWPAWTALAFGTAPIFLVATVTWERRLTQRGARAVVPLHLFGVRTFTAGLLAIAAFMLFFPSFVFTLALLLQDGLRLEPFEAGLVFVPAAVAFSLSSLRARQLFGRFGLRAPAAAAGLTALGLIGLILAAWMGAEHASVAVITVCAAVMSLGNGVVMPTLTTLALVDVDADAAGSASGLIATVHQFASAVGVAIVGTVFFEIAGTGGRSVETVHAAVIAGLVDLLLLGAMTASLVGIRRSRGPLPR